MLRSSYSVRAVLLTLAAVLSATAPRAVIHQVELTDTAIAPDSVTLAPGDSVRWLVISGSHQLHSDTDSFKSWDSGLLDSSGETFVLPIHYDDGSGPFLYLCLFDTHRGEIRIADSCWATGPLGSSGVPTVADLVYALRVIAGDAPPPDDLYRYDMSGDCVVNEQDAQLLARRFVFGVDSVPGYPVSTCCRPELVPGCLVTLTGDVNLSGAITSSDIIRLVSFVFIGGQPPLPCVAAADVNCSRTVTSADVIALVNYIFKGGPAPCDVCTLIPGLSSCP